MSLPEAVRSVLTRYVLFSGRAPRSELWWWVLACVLLFLAVGVVDLVVASVVGFSPVGLLLALALLVPSLAVSVRRLHDSGLSGWWVLLLLGLGLASGVVLVVGLLTLLVGAVQSAELAPGGGDGRATLTGGLVLVLAAAVVDLVVAVTWLVLMLRPSTPGVNRYGPPRTGWTPQQWSPPSGQPSGPPQQQPYGVRAYDSDETRPIRRSPS